MARLDPIIERLFREQGFDATFESGTPGELRTSTGTKPLFKIALTTTQIITAFAEIVPAEIKAGFPPDGTCTFAYTNPLGAVQIKIEKVNGAIKATIAPKGALGSSTTAPAPTPTQTTPSARPAAATPSVEPVAEVPKVTKPKEPRAQVEELMRIMVQRKASDLHCSSDNFPMLRVDGSMEPLREWGVLGHDELKAMLWTICPERNRAQWEELKDTDFAHETDLARFRVNYFSDRKGIGCVMRQIPTKIMSAEDMGLTKQVLDLCYLTKGLVLVTGPTGSGKSTTLAAMIDYVNRNRDDHIITIEDPIEFVHPNKKCLVNQREVGVHTSSFKHALRAALREDPDIVLVGEMRDLETIAIAMETAETGHLVFGTLHTTTAPSTVDRLIDQFPTDQQDQIRVMLSESLKAVIAQVLCKKIGGGRAPAHEILMVNSAVANLIREGKTFQILSSMQTGRNQGMITMNDSLLELVKAKKVEPKEAFMKSIQKAEMKKALEAAGFKVELQAE